MKGDPPPTCRQGGPQTLQEGPSAPAAAPPPAAPSEERARAPGAFCKQRQCFRAGALSTLGPRKRRQREPQRLPGNPPHSHPWGRWRWQEWSRRRWGSEPGRAHCPGRAPGDATTGSEEKGRSRHDGGLAPHSTPFSSCSALNTSQGSDLLLLPSRPKGRAAPPSASNKHSSSASGRAERSLPSEPRWGLGGNFLPR